MFNWNNCDTILLDMDGTLLDLNFDNHFWLEFVPLQYAKQNNLTILEAKNQLLPQFKQMEGKLEWYCLDYWTDTLQLNIVALKQEISSLIAVLPHVIEFLTALRKTSKQIILVTNAHPDSLNLKMEHTCLQQFFDSIISAHQFGMAKEQAGFWKLLQQQQGFNKDRTLLVDDNLSVLDSANEFGIQYLINILNPDSKKPVKTHKRYLAIQDFSTLIAGL